MTRVSYDFGGERAVVTGGASGIGAAIVRSLAAAGARVAVWDVSSEAPGDAASGGEALIRCDVSSAASVREARAATIAALGPPTMLVNCAGIVGVRAPALDSDPDEWARIFDVNLGGAVRVTRALSADLAAGGGRIVNIASMTGLDANVGYAAYSASKAALINVTQVLGKELAGQGVLVNAVAPGMVDSPFIGDMSDEYIADRRAKSALARLIRPEEVAAAVMWLLSDDCSFLTGFTLPLAGGRL